MVVVRYQVLFIACLSLLASGAMGAKKPFNLEEVVAIVDGVPITRGELEKKYSQNMLFVSQKQVTRKSVLQDMIARIVGIKRAKKANLQNDSTVKEKMETVLYHAQISKELTPELNKIEVTDRDVERYYNNNPEYRTAHILLRMRATPSEEEWKSSLNLAKKIYSEVKKRPKRFAEYANKYGQSANATTGGDMGFQPATRLAPEYYRAIKGKRAGYITPIVRTQYGHHIIKVLGVKNFKSINVPFYKKVVYDIKRDKILEQYFARLRQSAKIEYKTKLE